MIEILYYKILYVTTVKKIIKISNINPFRKLYKCACERTQNIKHYIAYSLH